MRSSIDDGVVGSSVRDKMKDQEHKDVLIIGRSYMSSGAAVFDDGFNGAGDVDLAAAIKDAATDLDNELLETTIPSPLSSNVEITNVQRVQSKKERSPLGQVSHNTRSGSGSGSATAEDSLIMIKTPVSSGKGGKSTVSPNTKIDAQSPSIGKGNKSKKSGNKWKGEYDLNTLASMEVAERHVSCLLTTTKNWMRIEATQFEKHYFERNKNPKEDHHVIILIDNTVNEMIDYYFSIQDDFTTEGLMQTKETWISYAERLGDLIERSRNTNALNWDFDEDCNDHNNKNGRDGFQIYNKIAHMRHKLMEISPTLEVYPVTYSILLDQLVEFANTWAKWRRCYPVDRAWDGKRDGNGAWIAVKGKKGAFKFVMDAIVEVEVDEEEVESVKTTDGSFAGSGTEDAVEENAGNEDGAEKCDESMEYIPPPPVLEMLETQDITISDVQSQQSCSMILGGSPSGAFAFNDALSAASENRHLSVSGNSNVNILTPLSRLTETISESNRATRYALRNLGLRLSVVETNTNQTEKYEPCTSMEKMANEHSTQIAEVLTFMHTQATDQHARDDSTMKLLNKLIVTDEKLQEKVSKLAAAFSGTFHMTTDDYEHMECSLKTTREWANGIDIIISNFQSQVDGDATLLREIKQMLEDASLPKYASKPKEKTHMVNSDVISELTRQITTLNEHFSKEKESNSIITAPSTLEEELASLKEKTIKLTSTLQKYVERQDGLVDYLLSAEQPAGEDAEEHALQYLWPQGYPTVSGRVPALTGEDTDSVSVQSQSRIVEVPGVVELGRGKTSPGFCCVM